MYILYKNEWHCFLITLDKTFKTYASRPEYPLSMYNFRLMLVSYFLRCF